MNEEEQSKFPKECIYELLMSTPYSQHEIGYIEFLPTKQEYELIKEDWEDEKSHKCFSENQIRKDHEIFEDESIRYYFNHHYQKLFRKRNFKEWIRDYVMDHVLQIWHHLFHLISPDILCMNSMVPNLFVTTNNTAIKSAVNSIRRLTNDKLFEGIDMFLVPILHGAHYYLCVINMAENEGYVINGYNGDPFFESSKKDYMQRALALIILCQKLDNKIPEFKPNIPKTFGLKDFKLKSCSVPPQSDGNICGMIVMMAIYPINIQCKSKKKCIV